MSWWSELTGAIIDLLHIEERRIVLSLARIETGFALLLVGLIVLLGAVGLLTAAAFMAIAKPLGNTLAALLTGGGILAGAVILLVVGRKMMH